MRCFPLLAGETPSLCCPDHFSPVWAGEETGSGLVLGRPRPLNLEVIEPGVALAGCPPSLQSGKGPQNNPQMLHCCNPFLPGVPWPALHCGGPYPFQKQPPPHRWCPGLGVSVPGSTVPSLPAWLGAGQALLPLRPWLPTSLRVGFSCGCQACAGTGQPLLCPVTGARPFL